MQGKGLCREHEKQAERNKTMNRIMVNDKSTLDALAKDSALTFEGMSPDEMV